MTPVNLITGFLGVGKTTAVLDLLRRRPKGSKWAIIVNEFGEVGIDGAIFDGELDPNLDVREVAGGCVCCTTLPLFEIHLALLLRDLKPERVLIETSGLAHPARILDKLRNPAYGDRLDVRATIALLSPYDFANKQLRESVVFQDQVQLADVLVLNRMDEAGAGVVERFQEWANALYPPKLLVAATSHGRLDPAWLDVAVGAARLPLFPEAHEHHQGMTVAHSPPEPGKPTRHVSPSIDPPACGWIFHAEDVFDEGRLMETLHALAAERFKGVFRTGPDEWILVQRAGKSITSGPIAYRRDSRVEVFGRKDWNALEASFRKAIRPVVAG